MLKEFVEKNHYKFIEKADSWQDAIRLSCQALEADGTIDERYAESIIECVNEYGPYIVIIPDVAMPHSTQGALGVTSSAISFMKVEQPVAFDADDREKDAVLFFTLAALDPDQHLENMQKLVELLSDDDVVEALKGAKSPEDLLEIQAKYID